MAKTASKKATADEMRDMLDVVRTLLGGLNACPFCFSEFEDGTDELMEGQHHEDWCPYESLMGMVL